MFKIQFNKNKTWYMKRLLKIWNLNHSKYKKLLNKSITWVRYNLHYWYKNVKNNESTWGCHATYATLCRWWESVTNAQWWTTTTCARTASAKEPTRTQSSKSKIVSSTSRLNNNSPNGLQSSTASSTSSTTKVNLHY